MATMTRRDHSAKSRAKKEESAADPKKLATKIRRAHQPPTEPRGGRDAGGSDELSAVEESNDIIQALRSGPPRRNLGPCMKLDGTIDERTLTKRHRNLDENGHSYRRDGQIDARSLKKEEKGLLIEKLREIRGLQPEQEEEFVQEAQDRLSIH